ncbi:hypothetical protein GLOTRDRAFT_129914 [Gloeophyllum trabeum ATCC 11539]|uniref:Uncharacterized protein n=1 Tax=Gloeophyllum trabeum (strain ATCC 11539 / FP-39264 / Madison 617) TaxID=670483 RepID=S7RP45_GLOTA|nr:uncharacterized protein GLOTRDRAFT_129914 [Gloeophyllum trabeum ATCC 11539]EPQ54564.1 hypothetical protein GLOTRDRAFT_129914 [Gloeophyllum trabeum ATCC 11539]
MGMLRPESDNAKPKRPADNQVSHLYHTLIYTRDVEISSQVAWTAPSTSPIRTW